MEIVVVGNEPEIELLFTKNLRPEFKEYSFCFVREENEAINLIRSVTQLGLALIDLDSVRLDGLSLLADLPQLNPSILGVAMSVRKDLDVIRATMNKGAFDFVPKPLDDQDLLSTFQRAAEYVKEARERQHIKSLDELKSRFFDKITHEFRPPLTLILGPVEKMLRETQSDSYRQNLQLVQRNARQLLRITNQLLDLARLEAGHLTVNPTPGNLGQFISQLVEAFQPLAEDKKISLIIQNELPRTFACD
jgi:signal transduction histidine kinase